MTGNCQKQLLTHLVAPLHLRYIIFKNPKKLSIFPVTSMFGSLAISVQEDTCNAIKFEHFLKHDLIGFLLTDC